MNTLYYGDDLKILQDRVLTFEDLLNGKQVQLPPSLHTFKQAEKADKSTDEQGELVF